MWSPIIHSSTTINKGEVEKLANLVGDCIDNAESLDDAIREKWFGAGFKKSVVEKCIGELQKWKKNTPRGLNIKYRGKEDDIASAPLWTKHKQLIGESKIGLSSVSINLGKHWTKNSVADGCKLLSLTHEMTHAVICTLDVTDHEALQNYPTNVVSQIPTSIQNDGTVYYGMKKVWNLAKKSPVAAVLNADNWAYFLAEARGKKANVSFLSSSSEASRTEVGWDAYNASTGFEIGSGELI